MKQLSILLMTMTSFFHASAQRIWDGPSTGGSWTTATNWSGDVLPVANEVVIFPTGISGIISNVNGGNNITVGGLVIQGNSNITFTNSSNKTITIANGTAAIDFSIASAATLTLGTNVDLTIASGTTTNNTAASIAGTFVVAANRTFDTNNGNVLTTVTGIIQNAGTVAGNIARLIFSNSGTYVHDRAGGNIPNATWNATSTCRITGMTNSDPGNDNEVFGNLVYNCPAMTGTRIMGGNGLLIQGNLEIINTGTGILRQGPADLNINGYFWVSGGTFRIGDNTNRTATVSGDLKIDGGLLQMSTGNNTADRGTLNVAGNFLHSGGTITETSDGRGTINFNGNGIQVFSKSLTASIGNNIDFNVNSGSVVDFGTSVLNGSTGTFTLNNGAKIITANSNGFNGNGTNNGSIQVTGTKTYSSLADYEFKGGSTGIFTTTVNPQVRNFIVNNPTGTITLSQPVMVNGSLVLTAGALTTTTVNLLTLSATASATTASNSSFVNGPLAKVFASPLTGFTFPVGKTGTGFRNIGITAPSAASTFRAEFFRSVPPAGTLGAGISQLSACEYWDLSRTAGIAGTSAKVVLSWEGNSSCNAAPYVTEQTTLRVAHLTAGIWKDEGYLASTGNMGAGTITSGNAMTTFSPFALAGSGPAENPLPVLFSNVKAFQRESGVQVEWSNLSEKDIVQYTVERSVNGSNFIAIDQQFPRSNTNDKVNYQAWDVTSSNGINLYRIKAQELTGKVFYSIVLSVDINKTKKELILYPNPVVGNRITLSLSGLRPGQIQIQVMNVSGQIIHKQVFSNTGSGITQGLELPLSIQPGVYNVMVTSGDFRENKSFLLERN